MSYHNKRKEKGLASVALWLERLKPAGRLTCRRARPKDIAGMEDAENHRPPTPDPRQKDGDIVIQVTLRTLSGRRLAFTTFRMRKDCDYQPCEDEED